MHGQDKFIHLYQQHYEALYFFARQFVFDREECHDIVSSVFEEIWRDLASVREETSKTLLYEKVKNKCIDHLRRSKRKETYIEYVKTLGDHYVQTDGYDRQKENERIIREVLSMMGHPTVDILKGCYMEGLSYKEVAERMGISPSTVKKYMIRALATIRQYRNKLNKQQP